MVTNVRVPSVNTRAPLSVQDLMNQAVDRFGATPTPVVPGSQAAAEGISQYNPAPIEVPPLPASGLTGVVNTPPLTAESTAEDLAQATQSPYAARERYAPLLDEQQTPQFDPVSGQYITNPIGMPQYAEEQSQQLATQPDYSSAFATEDPYEISQALLGAKNEVTPTMSEGDIRSWSDKAAPAMGIVSNGTLADMFDPSNSIIGSMEPGYEGVPVGIKVLHDEGLSLDYAKPLATVMGIAHALASNQTPQTPSRPDTDETPPDPEAVREEDLINSTIAASRNAFDRLGYNLKPESIRQLAEAKVKSAIFNGEHRPIKDAQGRWILSSSPSLKDMARELSYLTEALAGDEKRSAPSKTPQVSGANFLKPGSKLTRNSIKLAGTKAPAAEAAKDILGSIAEMFNPKSVMSTTKQLQDIQQNMVDDNTGYYSTSKFAKRHKVSKADYEKLKDRTQPPRNFKGTPDEVAKFEAMKNQHAREQIEQKLNMLQYDIKNANDMKGLLYTGYTHSLANQRFFRNSIGTDILASKGGVREMLNFGMQSLVQPVHLFDEQKVRDLKAKAVSIFKTTGVERQNKLMALSSSERTALGLMESAVVNYYSFSGDSSVHNSNIKKQSEVDLIQKYDINIAKHLASLGNEYNQWLADNGQSGKDFSNIEKILSKMPRGEAQAYQNLWDDMFNLANGFKNPNTKGIHQKLTALNYDDGNQNGIFLQSLYAGKPQISVRLGSYNPNLSDMRGYALNDLGQQISDLFTDDQDKVNSWKEFFKQATDAAPDDIASDLFKAPLMQNAYGKDASMFTEHIIEFFEDPTYGDAARKALLDSGIYTSTTEAAVDLSKALEATIRKVIDPKFVDSLKRIGRMFAILNTVPTIKGVAGDDLVFSSVDVGFVPDINKDVTWNEGDTTFKRRGKVTTPYQTPEGIVEASTAVRQLNPSASKGTQYFFNKKTNQFDAFENPLGSALSRLLGVMPIQSTDGDLLKLMLLSVNAGQKIPLPVATVHDSLITTMDTMHIYRNAYNNVSIPQAVPEIKKFAKQLSDAYDKAKSQVFEDVKDKTNIGIGSEGDYPSLGALFDELAKKINSEQYKELFLRRSHNSVEQWEKYVADSKERLRDAEKQGWRANSPYLAVNDKQFKALFTLAESLMKVGGAENRFKAWVNNFPGQVDNGFRQLNMDSKVRQHGIAQMTHA